MSRQILPAPVAWLKKRERTLVVFGAFIFAGTFILKEIVQDNFKDLKDSVTEAAHSFRERSEFMELRADGRGVYSAARAQRKMIEILRSAEQSGVGTGSQAHVSVGKYRELLFLEKRAPVDEEIENIEEILQRVELPEQAAKVRESKEELDRLQKESVAVDEKDNSSQLESLDSIRYKLDDLKTALLEGARKEEDRREFEYNVCKWINVLCFFLGLGLAIVGKLYDFKVFGDVD